MLLLPLVAVARVASDVLAVVVAAAFIQLVRWFVHLLVIYI